MKTKDEYVAIPCVNNENVAQFHYETMLIKFVIENYDRLKTKSYEKAHRIWLAEQYK